MSKQRISTEEELEALDKYAVILDGDMDVWQKRGDSWVSHETSTHTSKRLARYAPFVVLFKGVKQ